MSIYALTGLTGEGKSYSAVELFILPAISQNRPVITNIPMLPKFFEDYPDAPFYSINLDAAKENSSIFDAIPNGALVLFDELWRIWPQGLKVSDIPEWQLSFVKEHRHRIADNGQEMDIVLVTQDLSDIASAIRGMAQTTIICRKAIELGKPNYFRRDYYRGSVKGQKGSKDAFIRSDLGCSYKQEIYQYYKSHTKGDNKSSLVNNDILVKASIFSGFYFKALAFSLVFIILVIIYSVYNTSKGLDKAVNKRPDTTVPLVESSLKINQNPPLKQTAVSVQPVELPKPVESKRWRLSGYFAVQTSVKYYTITDGNVSRRLSPQNCHLDNFDGGVCVLDGEVIASYTGGNQVAMLDEIPANGLKAIPALSN